jgi:hypothetical protein
MKALILCQDISQGLLFLWIWDDFNMLLTIFQLVLSFAVRCLGTEGRAHGGAAIGPSDQVFETVVFKGELSFQMYSPPL